MLFLNLVYYDTGKTLTYRVVLSDYETVINEASSPWEKETPEEIVGRWAGYLGLEAENVNYVVDSPSNMKTKLETTLYFELKEENTSVPCKLIWGSSPQLLPQGIGSISMEVAVNTIDD